MSEAAFAYFAIKGAKTMLNALWIFLFAGGLAYAALTGQPQLATQAAMEGATEAVSLVLSLLGITMFYMGLMEIATQSGLAKKISGLAAVVIQPLFPHLKKEEPAMQAVCMNLSANALGLGNAATPLGLVAMEELQKKNKDKSRATDEMVSLIVLNASSVQLIPTSIIALRAAAGSGNPAGITGVMLLSTLCTTLTGAILCRVLQK